MTLQSVRKAAVFAAVICIAVTNLTPFCQATPLGLGDRDSQSYGYYNSWSDGFAREEESIVEEVMDRISSELEVLSQQQPNEGITHMHDTTKFSRLNFTGLLTCVS